MNALASTETELTIIRREVALVAIEALTGWTPAVDIALAADGSVERFHMTLQTSAMGGPGTRRLTARMDRIGRCMFEVEEEPARQQSNDFSTTRRWQPHPLPVLLHRSKPEGPMAMLKMAMHYVADNPVGDRQPSRLVVLTAAGRLL
jgi:hypothetical protein